MVRPRAVHGDGVFAAPQEPARPVEDAGAGAARSHIDGADEIAHQGPVRSSVAISAGSCRMSSKIASGRRAVAASRNPQREAWEPPVKAKTRMPARLAASMPAVLSSMTSEAAGDAPMALAACRKRSGAGLPFLTMLALYMYGSSLSRRPVTASERRMRSGWLEEATQRGTVSASMASATPEMGLSSLRKRS